MSVDEALRLVEERNSSRNWSPAATAEGLRLQSAGTSVAAGATVEALVTAGTPSEPVVKDAASLPATSWKAVASSPAVGSV